MKELKFSLGTWTALPYPMDCGKEYVGKWWIQGPPDEDGFRSLAIVNPRGRLPNDGEETKANAILFAAAPTLLDAIQKLEWAAKELDRQADICAINCDQTSKFPCLTDAACVCKLALDNARAAIAKAIKAE